LSRWPAFRISILYGGGGVNTLTVDSSNGLINVPTGFTFNAGDPVHAAVVVVDGEGGSSL